MTAEHTTSRRVVCPLCGGECKSDASGYEPLIPLDAVKGVVEALEMIGGLREIPDEVASRYKSSFQLARAALQALPDELKEPSDGN